MIRVGLIGAGFIGRNHFNQYEKLAGRATVVALCDRDAARLAGDWSGVGGNLGDAQGSRRDLGRIKPYADWRDLIHDPQVDLVDICAPTFLHPEIAIAALQAGKHVLCEKPMALTVAACERILEASAAARGRFMIAQCIRFWPEYMYLRSLVKAGTHGPLRALSLRRQAAAPAYSLNQWLLNPELSGGAVLDLHVHDVDYVLGLLGAPASVVATGYLRPNQAMDRIHALWHYPGGPAVQLEGCWDMPEGFDFNMGFTAVFDAAAVSWDFAANKPLTLFRAGQPPEQPALPAGDAYFNEIDYFVSCIERREAPQISTPAESRSAVAIALAEKRSVLEGRPILLAELG